MPFSKSDSLFEPCSSFTFIESWNGHQGRSTSNPRQEMLIEWLWMNKSLINILYFSGGHCDTNIILQISNSSDLRIIAPFDLDVTYSTYNFHICMFLSWVIK